MFPLAALWWFCLKIKGELGQLGSYWNFPSLCFKITIPQKQLHSKRSLLTLKKCLRNIVRRQTHHLFIIFFSIGKVFTLQGDPALPVWAFLYSFKYQKVCLDSTGDECHLVLHLIANRLRLCCHDPFPALSSLTMYCILIIHLNLTFNLCPYWDRMFFRV